jgi:class I fructose-bisphosphate aldolase
MHIGKAIRLERIINRNTKRTIIVPMDHGTTVGPLPGIVNMREAVQSVVEGGANAVLMHKGVPRCCHRNRGNDVGLIVHLSASTSLSPLPNAKTLVCSVEEAIRMGADAVSVHVNLGDESEAKMLEEFGRVTESAQSWGMPVLAMVYARGPKVHSEYDPDIVAHCARVGVELGADVVKVPYTGDPDSFAHVTAACCVPVVIAGGPKLDSTRDFLVMVRDSIRAGGSGLSVGRNIFQHKRPDLLTRALAKVVHEDAGVDEALTLVAGVE